MSNIINCSMCLTCKNVVRVENGDATGKAFMCDKCRIKELELTREILYRNLEKVTERSGRDFWRAKLAEDKVSHLRETLVNLESYASLQVCEHENTHRGGAIWEICDDCGGEWADDRGGKPEFTWPAEILAARQAIKEQDK